MPKYIIKFKTKKNVEKTEFDVKVCIEAEDVNTHDVNGKKGKDNKWNESETERGPERSCTINTQGSELALEICPIATTTKT